MNQGIFDILDYSPAIFVGMSVASMVLAISIFLVAVLIASKHVSLARLLSFVLQKTDKDSAEAISALQLAVKLFERELEALARISVEHIKQDPKVAKAAFAQFGESTAQSISAFKVARDKVHATLAGKTSGKRIIHLVAHRKDYLDALKKVDPIADKILVMLNNFNAEIDKIALSRKQDPEIEQGSPS